MKLRGIHAVHSRCLAALCWMATIAAQGQTIDAQSEAQRLTHERSDLDARRAAGRARCHQLFSVNSCLSDVERQYRDERRELDRQQRVLNTESRAARSAQNVLSLENKALAVPQAAPATPLAGGVGDPERAARLTQTPRPARAESGGKSPPAPAKARTANPVKTRAANPVKTRAAVPDANHQAEIQVEYRRKQAEQAQRKSSADQRRRERTKPLAPPLPTASAAATGS